ncbi:hypothetical protein GWK47_002133 [Chionoecetes opilio]|uniref:Uncharacterized protein n=1 Tax=Chionoecetes opilio TaxID=41210 RepID=A0A8J4XSW8_CHIOP|nr:hypothetical protein GWK47_002133 [Chionoecetes opilio]
MFFLLKKIPIFCFVLRKKKIHLSILSVDFKRVFKFLFSLQILNFETFFRESAARWEPVQGLIESRQQTPDSVASIPKPSARARASDVDPPARGHVKGAQARPERQRRLKRSLRGLQDFFKFRKLRARRNQNFPKEQLKRGWPKLPKGIPPRSLRELTESQLERCWAGTSRDLHGPPSPHKSRGTTTTAQKTFGALLAFFPRPTTNPVDRGEKEDDPNDQGMAPNQIGTWPACGRRMPRRGTDTLPRHFKCSPTPSTSSPGGRPPGPRLEQGGPGRALGSLVQGPNPVGNPQQGASLGRKEGRPGREKAKTLGDQVESYYDSRSASEARPRTSRGQGRHQQDPVLRAQASSSKDTGGSRVPG